MQRNDRAIERWIPPPPVVVAASLGLREGTKSRTFCALFCPLVPSSPSVLSTLSPDGTVGNTMTQLLLCCGKLLAIVAATGYRGGYWLFMAAIGDCVAYWLLVLWRLLCEL